MKREDSVKEQGEQQEDVSQDLLPRFRPQEWDNLQRDRHDPLAKTIILEYNRYIDARRKCLSQSDRVLRQHGIKNLREELAALERLLEKKRHDDSLLVEYDFGQYILVDVVGVKNLPPTAIRKDLPTPYCTVMMTTPQMAKPAADGLKTACKWCTGAKSQQQQNCRRHMTKVSKATTNPKFNQRFKFKVNTTLSEIMICVYNFTSVGAHELMGWFHIPSHTVLYTQPLEREYGLLDAHEIPIQTTVLGDEFMEYQNKNPAITIRWSVQLRKSHHTDKFQAPSTSTKKWHGWHFKRWDSGMRYVGEWDDGLPHGKGKYYGVDGGSYEGQWARGVIHGQGTFWFANGDSYSGQWRHGFRHGHGRSDATNGDVYEGNWRFGTQHGFGRHWTSEGEEYVGEWKSNLAHGTGTFREVSGLKWDGVWYEGRVCYRGDDRPPTPPGHVSKLESKIVEVRSDDMANHNLPAMNIRLGRTLNSRIPCFFPDGFHIAKTHAADALLFGEEPDDVPSCFFDRNKEALLEMPCFDIEMRRTVEKNDGPKEEFYNRRRRLPVEAKPETTADTPMQPEPEKSTLEATPATGPRLPVLVSKGASVKQLLQVAKGASVKQLLKKIGSSKLLSFPFAKTRQGDKLSSVQPGEQKGGIEEVEADVTQMESAAQTDQAADSDRPAAGIDQVPEEDVEDRNGADNTPSDPSQSNFEQVGAAEAKTSKGVNEIEDDEVGEGGGGGGGGEGGRGGEGQEKDMASTVFEDAVQSEGKASGDGESGSGEEEEGSEHDETDSEEEAEAESKQAGREPSKMRHNSSLLLPSDERGGAQSEDGSDSSGGSSSQEDARQRKKVRAVFAPFSALTKMWRGK